LAHSKSAKKRIRQNAKERLRNRSTKSALRTTIKKFNAALKTGEVESAAAAYKAVQKKVDTTARKGIVHKGTAARVKSRLAARLSKLKSEPAAE